MNKFFGQFIPTSVSSLEQTRAKVLVATCFAIGGAILAMLLYTSSVRKNESTTTLNVSGMMQKQLCICNNNLLKKRWRR